MAENVEPGLFGPAGPSGPAGLDEKVSPTWLILQRLEDLNKRMDSLEQRLDQRIDDRFNTLVQRIGDFRSVNWVILVAVLGMLAKLFFPAL